MMKKLFILTALVMLVVPASGCGCGCFPRLFRGARAEPCCPPGPCEPNCGCAYGGGPVIGPGPMIGPAPVGPPVGAVVPGPPG